MAEAKLLSLKDLELLPAETAVFIETKQTLRPAFYMGIIDRVAIGIVNEFRYAVNLITAAKIAKHWEWRLNNKSWRVWSEKPTRQQRIDAEWDS